MNISKGLPYISVIVPVYNSEKFLNRCLTSIKNQTLKNIEVIVVNDGSTDSSLDIINSFSKKYSNFIVLNLENKGVSNARNKAIAIAKGKYLSFVDSDDFICPDFLETLYNQAVMNNADIVYCGYSLYIEKSNKIVRNLPLIRHGLYTSSKKILNILIKDFRLHSYLWNKLFKKSLFLDNNITLHDMYYEDMAACTPLFYYAKNIVIVNKPLYFYTVRKGSLVRDITIKNFNDYIRVLAVIRTFFEKNKVYKDYRLSFILYSLRTMITSIKLLFFTHLKIGSFKKFIPNLINTMCKITYCISKKFKPINDISSFPDVINSPK